MGENPFEILNKSLVILLSKALDFSAVAAFSLRKGGQSPPPFDSLNFSVKQGDTLENVRSNLTLLAKHLDIDGEKIATCNQVHGDTIAVMESAVVSPPEADAIIGAAPGIFPAVKTADCVPILILDPSHRVSAAVHAGSRGTALRITHKVVRFMQKEFGTSTSDLVVALGPAIGPCCYDVDEEVVRSISHNIPGVHKFVVVEKFSKNTRPANITDQMPRFFWRANPHDAPLSKGGTSDLGSEINLRLGTYYRSLVKKTRYRIDLIGLNRFELTSMGVKADNIYATGYCTSCLANLFFSHRRDGSPSGRHIAIAGFKE